MNSSSNYDRALNEAIDRDLRDKERLEFFAGVIAKALDTIARDVYPMEHPDARWQPGDLVDVLQEQAKNISGELNRLRGQVVL